MVERIDCTGFPVCYECRYCHIESARHGFSQYECTHPKVISRDIVTGHRGNGECAEQRKADGDGKCGITGRFWEPRISLLAKFRIWWNKLDF
jgi:hypothetical protein